ncbi:hypothetical protein ONS79_16080 [Aeromonas hydrophila subsp. hydrophila]|uniref:hypothetical protein n=1 Tax=Aeromonas hydrophila TaxID=644 RepID=UPI0013036533|nr:hypothetical protein [Aeromonas hydrophila]MDF5705109.1 hypothetical protein [Aeromonas hydrophila subsp. hydrophila]QGZ72500.1 hypothetical protein GQR50_08205 [Aeromonas hydrophila]
MARLTFPFFIHLWETTSSVAIMKMLAEQAEKNVERVIKEAVVMEGRYWDEAPNEYGEDFPFERTYYTCGSCIGYDHDDVKSEYIHLLTQLTRRSAFLTIFGLFEDRMGKCMSIMTKLSGYTYENKKKLGVVEKTHFVLGNVFGGGDISDVEHLTIIRNVMAHCDSVAHDYKSISVSKEKKTERQNRLLRAIRRAEDEKSGISVNYFNRVLMDERFLMYTVGEIQRYVDSLETAIQTYCKAKSESPL